MYQAFLGICIGGTLVLTGTLVRADVPIPPRFNIPLQCEIPAQCVVQNYMDIRPGPGVRDFSCGTLSYERHKGTDFRVLDYLLYKKGVQVLSAADGIILRTRDGESEGTYVKKGDELITGIEGGNGVVVQHDDGWQTLYAHLRKGSISVSVGDKVKAGDTLGIVGLSGKTEFTHLHFQVMHDQTIYDPYTGTVAAGCHSKLPNSLWNVTSQKTLEYIGTGLVESSFSSEIPIYKKLPFSDERDRIALKENAKVLVYWMEAWGVRIADRLTMTYTDPSGKVSTSQKVLKKNQASYFKYLGKKKPKDGWLSGQYIGNIILERIIDGHWKTVFSSKSEITFS